LEVIFGPGRRRTLVASSDTYIELQETWIGIPPLEVGSSELTSNGDKVQAQTDNFFLKITDAQDATAILWEPISELETCRASKPPSDQQPRKGWTAESLVETTLETPRHTHPSHLQSSH
jgi:hypothetical protein